MAGTVLEVTREQVLAYRVMSQRLDRRFAGPPSGLEVLDLGVQDTPYGSARLALAARMPRPVRPGPPRPPRPAGPPAPPEQNDELVLVWAARGAPHLHRRADLPRLVAALWPLGDADAASRILSGQTPDAGRLGLRAFESAARAFREVVTVAMPKGEASKGVSARVPPEVTYDCRVCAARHISGSLFQQAGPAGGVRLRTAGRSTTLVPLDEPPGIPETAVGTESLVSAYLKLHGPATPRDAAGFLGVKPSELPRVWPDGLVEVRVDGRRAWLPEDRVEALRSAVRARSVRLLPPSDPLLQARDRSLLVPERARHKEVWRILGNPGALLVDGEITGTWRALKKGRNGLEVTVTPFGGSPPARVRAAVEEESARMGEVRGLGEVLVRYAG